VNELALFAGAGGGILGGRLLGWRTVCAVEIDRYARDVLLARQDDGCLEPFPIWDDVRTFDGRPWRGLVDVITGGFPCQDISIAGKGKGIDGERSGLWRDFARIIREVRPGHVLVENSPALTSRGLGRVLGDLAALGYDARWGVLGAIDAGAPHRRERIWIVANSKRQLANADLRGRLHGQAAVEPAEGWVNALGQSIASGANVANADRPGFQEQRRPEPDGAEHEAAERGDWWIAEPDVGRVADGVAARVDRLRCIGNGQVPAVVALAWRLLGPGGPR
jgi:DNA (cytosine-5)-methyltransferase 1